MHFMYAVAILPQLYKDEEVESVVKDGKFCLQKQEDHYQLKRDHAYYYQVHMHVHTPIKTFMWSESFGGEHS